MYGALPLGADVAEELDRPVPPWLADIAAAVSALDTTGDGALLTLEMVRARYPQSKAGDPLRSRVEPLFPR